MLHMNTLGYNSCDFKGQKIEHALHIFTKMVYLQNLSSLRDKIIGVPPLSSFVFI